MKKGEASTSAAMAVFQDFPDLYLIDYHPYRGGTNPNHQGDSQTLVYMKSGYNIAEDRKANFLLNISTWLKGGVKSLIDQNKIVVIAIAPGHGMNSPTGFMHGIVQALAQQYPGNIIDGGHQLIRTMDVLKSATTPGLRSVERHRGTIGINADNTGKVVIILDDIWTSGSTLNACKEVMSTTGPVDIRLFAIGKTAS